MRIGLYQATQWREGADLGRETANLVEQVRVARANGFGSIMVGQHFVSRPLQMFQAIPLLARLTAEAEGMLIGPALVLLPLFNPVVVAEEAATIDWMSGGNYVLAVGLGYRQEEFASLGVPFRERVPRFVEGIAVIRKLWRDDEVNHDGRFFPLKGVRASVKPQRPGGPPLWIGGDVEAAAKRAARIGDAWLLSPMVPLAEAERLVGVFNDTRRAAGLAPAACPVIRECHVGALDEVRAALLFKYQAYASWGQDGTGSVPAGRLAQDFDRFAAERFVIGDEAQVLDGIERYRAATGTDHIMFRLQGPASARRRCCAASSDWAGSSRSCGAERVATHPHPLRCFASPRRSAPWCANGDPPTGPHLRGVSVRLGPRRGVPKRTPSAGGARRINEGG